MIQLALCIVGVCLIVSPLVVIVGFCLIDRVANQKIKVYSVVANAMADALEKIIEQKARTL